MMKKIGLIAVLMLAFGGLVFAADSLQSLNVSAFNTGAWANTTYFIQFVQDGNHNTSIINVSFPATYGSITAAQVTIRNGTLTDGNRVIYINGSATRNVTLIVQGNTVSIYGLNETNTNATNPFYQIWLSVNNTQANGSRTINVTTFDFVNKSNAGANTTSLTVTPNTITYYTIAATSSTPNLNSNFNLSVTAFDQGQNQNFTDGFSGTWFARGGNPFSNIESSLDCVTFTAYNNTGVIQALDNGANSTCWRIISGSDTTYTFTFNDTNSATDDQTVSLTSSPGSGYSSGMGSSYTQPAQTTGTGQQSLAQQMNAPLAGSAAQGAATGGGAGGLPAKTIAIVVGVLALLGAGYFFLFKPR